jgi:hypothetical protein
VAAGSGAAIVGCMRRRIVPILALVLAGACTPAREGGCPAPAPPPPPGAADLDGAVARGLRWLRERQTPYGAWLGDVGHKRGDSYIVYRRADEELQDRTGHVGVSALAGLAFLASGHLPDRGEHAPVLSRALLYLLSCGGEHAYLTDSGTRMYSHAFAVHFLAQVHGMSHRHADLVARRLRDAAAFIVAMQNRHGGWRYLPGSDDCDLSVTVCQVQALRAARAAGMLVPRATIDRAVAYVLESRIQEGSEAGAFHYKIRGRGARSRTSYAVNAAAVTCLHAAGLYDPALYGGALEWIEDAYASVSRDWPHHYYYWYGTLYAVQALNFEGGARFDRFFARVSRDLLARQEADGRWRNDTGPGDEFATAVACLLLRVPLGYLPMFQR